MCKYMVQQQLVCLKRPSQSVCQSVAALQRCALAMALFPGEFGLETTTAGRVLVSWYTATQLSNQFNSHSLSWDFWKIFTSFFGNSWHLRIFHFVLFFLLFLSRSKKRYRTVSNTFWVLPGNSWNIWSVLGRRRGPQLELTCEKETADIAARFIGMKKGWES